MGSTVSSAEVALGFMTTGGNTSVSERQVRAVYSGIGIYLTIAFHPPWFNLRSEIEASFLSVQACLRVTELVHNLMKSPQKLQSKNSLVAFEDGQKSSATTSPPVTSVRLRSGLRSGLRHLLTLAGSSTSL